MNRTLFVSKPENYQFNTLEGAETHAQPAWLSGPQGREPGIIVRSGHRIKFIIPAAEAIRIANEIADAVEEIERAA